jgi:hypothetical protein
MAAAADNQRPIGVDAPPVTTPPGPEPEHVFSRKITTGAMKARASGGLRKLATNMAESYPEMDVHQHLQDAARELDSGRTHSAQRHVNAAIFGLQPLQLRRHGVHDDAGHMRGKAMMQQAHRHLLLIKDIEDVHGSNRAIGQYRRDVRDQERAMRAAPPVAVAASWDTHLHAIELATFAGAKPGSGKNFAKLQGVLAKRGARNPGALAAYIGRKKYGRKGFAKLGSKHASQLDALELAFRFRHGWIRLDGGGSVSPRQRAAAAAGERASRSTAAFKGTLASRRAAAKVRPGRGAADYGAVIGDFPGMPNRGKLGGTWHAGSAAEVAASGAGFPLETRQKKGPGLVQRIERAAARFENGTQPKTVGPKGRPPATSRAKMLADERADAGKYAAGMGRNKAKAVAKETARQQRVYRAARAKGHSHNKALAIARSIGRSFQAGSAVPPMGYSTPMEPPPFPVTGARLN